VLDSCLAEGCLGVGACWGCSWVVLCMLVLGWFSVVLKLLSKISLQTLLVVVEKKEVGSRGGSNN